MSWGFGVLGFWGLGFGVVVVVVVVAGLNKKIVGGGLNEK